MDVDSDGESPTQDSVVVINSSEEEQLGSGKKKKLVAARESAEVFRKHTTSDGSKQSLKATCHHDGKKLLPHARLSMLNKDSELQDDFRHYIKSWATDVKVDITNLKKTVKGLALADELDIGEHENLVGKKQQLDSVLSLVKVGEGYVPITKHIKSVNSAGKTKNCDLPDGCLQGGRWRLVFVPTFSKWLGT
ncbi:hypothetical protein SERLA73DRAFT_156364 [Serpula lacrymans var. lacrymans S7.3]|uniref:Uncharacterized protein n=1 Tax=Serpula lacrymans var. lacrymans (strain S7.3) TaxID=936435 RepID=F8QE59_SERL3|nr:hypothetical protein SERLA73DRAFT_156364 [Serpula lacrymans var. lacrymans S7.3]